MRRIVSILLVASLALSTLLPTLAAAQDEVRLRVDADSLNVRSGPGTDFGVIATLKRDEVVTKLREEGSWVQVQLASGATGWVSSRFVVPGPGGAGKPQIPAEQPVLPVEEPPPRPEIVPAPSEEGGGGGSAFGTVLKWTCLAGAAACAGLALNEKSQGDDAYDAYKDMFDETGQLEIGITQEQADDKFAEAEDHDDKAQTFWIASGGLFAAWFVGQFVLGRGGDDSASLSQDAPVRIAPGLGAVRASVVLARF